MHLTAYTNRLEQVDQTLVLPLADLADSPEYADQRLIHSRVRRAGGERVRRQWTGAIRPDGST